MSCFIEFSGEFLQNFFSQSTMVCTGLVTGVRTYFLTTNIKGFISLVDEIQFMLISSRHICVRSNASFFSDYRAALASTQTDRMNLCVSMEIWEWQENWFTHPIREWRRISKRYVIGAKGDHNYSCFDKSNAFKEICVLSVPRDRSSPA